MSQTPLEACKKSMCEEGEKCDLIHDPMPSSLYLFILEKRETASSQPNSICVYMSCMPSSKVYNNIFNMTSQQEKYINLENERRLWSRKQALSGYSFLWALNHPLWLREERERGGKYKQCIYIYTINGILCICIYVFFSLYVPMS